MWVYLCINKQIETFKTYSYEYRKHTFRPQHNVHF